MLSRRKRWFTDVIEFNDAAIGGAFVSDGCGANIKMMTSQFAQMNSFCGTPTGTSAIEVVDSTIATLTEDSAVFLEQTQGVFVNVDATSTTASATGPYLLYGGSGSDSFLIGVTLNTNACADNNGKTSDCYTAIDQMQVQLQRYTTVALLMHCIQTGTGRNGDPTQIPEAGVTVTASVLDSNGAELFPEGIFSPNNRQCWNNLQCCRIDW